MSKMEREPDPEILALMGEKERKRLLQRGANRKLYPYSENPYSEEASLDERAVESSWGISATVNEEGHERLLQHEINRKRYLESEKSSLDERKAISKILEQPSWLRRNDLEFVKSLSRQLEERRRTQLSGKQLIVLWDIYKRWLKNQEPRFVQGGSPGRGRRR